MALFQGDLYSLTLDKMTSLRIYLPGDDADRFHLAQPQKTLILLHGLESNSSYWMRYSSVERYAQSRNLALVMPEGEHSLYADGTRGPRYDTWLVEELLKRLHSMFGLNTDRDSLSIAGLSSGGYGAIRLALTYPDIFGRCASFSGTLMTGSPENLRAIAGYTEPQADGYDSLEALDRTVYYAHIGTYGEKLSYSPENDILALARAAVASKKNLPDVLLTCGTADFLCYINHDYQQKLQEIGINSRLITWQGGHDWKFWDESVRDYIDFFVDGIVPIQQRKLRCEV